jgi:hypothetical protein
MIRAEEIRKDNQIGFAVSVLETRPLRAKPQVPVRALEANVLNLSGSQLLVGFLSASCMVGLMLWAVLKLWLAGR